MAIDAEKYIGLRVARWRDVAGMTQQALADQVGVTREYISLIENGHKAISKRSLLINLAGALGVSVMDLIAADHEPSSREDMLALSIAASVRQALDADTPDTQVAPAELSELARSVIAARMACDNVAMADILAPAIAQARAAAIDGADEQIKAAGLDALVKTCVYGSYVLKTAGNFDLAMRLAERAKLAADTLDSPVHKAAASMGLAQSLMASGLRERALKVTTAGMEATQTLLSDPAGLVWYGTLGMQAGLTSASLGRHDEANSHMAEAADLAERAQDADHGWGNEFTPANVKLWKMGVALENGEPGRAPELARTIDVTQFKSPQRVTRLHIDTGRGHYLAGNHEAAIIEFQHAYTSAPTEVRHRASVRDIVGELVRNARRNAGSPALRDLAVKVGVDPVREA